MKSKLNSYWKKTETLRASLPNLLPKKGLFANEDDPDDITHTLTERINTSLLKYKEIRMVYKKTGIAPAWFLYSLCVCLIFIFVGYFDSYLTILIATVYPLYISIKTLKRKDDGSSNTDEDSVGRTMEERVASNKKDICQWLTYWVVYSLFIDFEAIFGVFLKYIPFYFFIKVVFLLVLFLPQYNLAAWIYDAGLRNVFNKYETHILDFSNTIVRKMTNRTAKSKEKQDDTIQPGLNKDIVK